jgi:hypothetical protein
VQVAGDCLGDVKTQAILPKYHVGFASIDFAFFTLGVSHRNTKTNRCALSGVIDHFNQTDDGVVGKAHRPSDNRRRREWYRFAVKGPTARTNVL